MTSGYIRFLYALATPIPPGAAEFLKYSPTVDGSLNTDNNLFEGYSGSWGGIGGGESNFTTQTFTGDGSQAYVDLSQIPNSEDNLMVFIEGVYQNQDAYSVSGTTLTMADAPVDGRGLVVYQVSAAVAGAGMAVNTMTGDNSDTTLTLAVAPTHVNNVQVFFDGVYQKADTYTVSGTTLTFGVAPPTGVLVEARTHSQTEINTFPATGISGLTAVQPVAGDFMMILDATDAALKKADVKDIMATAVSITSAADAVAMTFDSSENATFSANVTVTGDLTVTGDDITMATNTAGHLLVGDGTNYNPVAVSGAATLAANGTVTIANNAILTQHIDDNQITADQIAANTIATGNIYNPSNQVNSAYQANFYQTPTAPISVALFDVAGWVSISGMVVGEYLEFSFTNSGTGSNSITVTASAGGWTEVGSMVIAAQTTARFRMYVSVIDSGLEAGSLIRIN